MTRFLRYSTLACLSLVTAVAAARDEGRPPVGVGGGRPNGPAAGAHRAAGQAHRQRAGMNRTVPAAGASHSTHRGEHHAASGSLSASGFRHAVKAGAGPRPDISPGTPPAGNLGEHGARGNQGGLTDEAAARLRDQRLERAAHLREVGTANGNARLQETADRMEGSAERQYARRVPGTSANDGDSENPPVVDPLADVAPPPAVDIPTADPTVPPLSEPPAAARAGETRASSRPLPRGKSSWLPSWLR
ncbi:MAG: hypothetical protein U0935_10075 [Pirellulales bacterium]